MSKYVLYTQTGCAPCRYLEKIIKDHNLDDVIFNQEDGYHPLVNQRPTLIIDNTSAIVGVLAIEKYIKKHLVKDSE